MQDDASAREIAEDMLVRTRQALMSDDFETFRHCFLLPMVVETFEGKRKIETPDELREMFDAIRAYFHRRGITEVVRNCVEARFKDRDTLEATHETRLIADGTLLQRPYPVYSLLHRVDGAWRIGDGMYALEETDSLGAEISPILKGAQQD